jgi:hypothetical protein
VGCIIFTAITYYIGKRRNKKQKQKWKKTHLNYFSCLASDLKSLNCLVTEQYGIKIADFGESKHAESTKLSKGKMLSLPTTLTSALNLRLSLFSAS